MEWDTYCKKVENAWKSISCKAHYQEKEKTQNNIVKENIIIDRMGSRQ